MEGVIEVRQGALGLDARWKLQGDVGAHSRRAMLRADPGLASPASWISWSWRTSSGVACAILQASQTSVRKWAGIAAHTSVARWAGYMAMTPLKVVVG